MPQYEEFLKNDDREAFAEQICMFWKKALTFDIKMQTEDVNKVEETVESILEILKDLCVQSPPTIVAGSHHLVLEKI